MPALLIAQEIKLHYSASHPNQLTKWEKNFIGQIKNSKILSRKQIAKVEEIYEDLRFGDRFYFADVDETWADWIVDQWDRTI